MTERTDRHREIATKIAIRAGRGADEQYVAAWLATVCAEERAEFTRLIREKLAEPDVSATADQHLIGFKSGWRIAIRRVLDELSE
jgi:hypothetical protein